MLLHTTRDMTMQSTHCHECLGRLLAGCGSRTQIHISLESAIIYTRELVRWRKANLSKVNVPMNLAANQNLLTHCRLLLPISGSETTTTVATSASDKVSLFTLDRVNGLLHFSVSENNHKFRCLLFTYLGALLTQSAVSYVGDKP